MQLTRFLFIVSMMFVAQASRAGTIINTNGSQEGVAISGYDTVAFFTVKNAVKGKENYSHEWMGAKWLFASEENLNLFKADPEKYAPQYGGNCSVGVSENYISRKPANGSFEIVDGKLYLFPAGTNWPDGPYRDWHQRGGGPHKRIRDGDVNWLKLKQRLESR